MISSRHIALAGALVLMPGLATAADMPIYAPAPILETGGWYLRGDIGMTNQRISSYSPIVVPAPVSYTVVDKGKFDSGYLAGLGVGYQFNRWLRVDLTGEYRGETAFHARDYYFNSSSSEGYDEYHAKKSEWLFLANAYVDLGTWYGLTPFLGAGIGTARINLSDYRDYSYPGPSYALDPTGGGYAPSKATWNFAWALHAGLAYQLAPNAVFEVAYRYVNMGDAKTADVLAMDGSNPTPNNPTTFRNIDSHDVKVGLRWMLGGGYSAEPLVRKF